MHEAKIYGFRVNERAKTGPRMHWLRSRPVDVTELDEMGKYHAEHGGDGEDDFAGGRGQGGPEMGAAKVVDRRKKAVARSRKGMGGRGGVDVMDMNGGPAG